MKHLKWIIMSILILSFGTSGWTKEKSMVAVLPFTVHSAENIDYVRQGIWDMLTSRISASDQIAVTEKNIALADIPKTAPQKELTLADVYGLGKKLNVDFVVWGSITKIGNNVSIDGKLVDINTYKSPVVIFAQSQGLDEIIPKINDFAQRINNHILGVESLPAPSAAAAPTPVPDQTSPQAAREKELIAGMRATKKGTFTAIPINPDFINSPQMLDRKGFWMSQQFGTEFKGIDIGDVNNDGVNEVVAIDSSNVFIYQRKGSAFLPVHQIKGKRYDAYLSVDVADINNNGVKEIIVTSIVRDVLNSFVIEWREGKFVTIASKLPWFMRIISDASGSPLLMGQRLGTDTAFEMPVQEIVWNGTEYLEGRKMKVPQGLSVYAFILDALESRGTEKIIAFDEYDHLVVYEKTDKSLDKINVFGGGRELLWKSEDVFGGSNIAFDPYNKTIGSDEEKILYFVNTRIIPYDINKDGKKELIVVRNRSATGRLFRNMQVFTSSEIYDLEWDGMGLVENWKTKKINGYVADYQFKDIDNDGENEIVLALVLSVGATFEGRSVIVAYKLVPQVEGAASK